MKYQKPKRLSPGDRVAVLSPSWGGPSVYPHIFDRGIRSIEALGLSVIEFPSARMDADILRKNPRLRGEDITAAFQDDRVRAVFASIGGSGLADALPFVDTSIVSRNPKLFMGFSDSTALHVLLSLNGIVSFYGPSIMAGFSQMEVLPREFFEHVRTMLFEPSPLYTYRAYDSYCNGYPDWAILESTGITKPFQKNDGWHWLQETADVSGTLFGGCIEVLSRMRGTPFWPENDFWNKKILFLESSGEHTSLADISKMLHRYGDAGIFERIHGVLFGRLRDVTLPDKKNFDIELLTIIAHRYGRTDIPIISNVDTGHTDPQFIFPLGIVAEISSDRKSISLIEPCLS